MGTKRKAQVSVEAISLTGFLVLFLVMGMGFFMTQFMTTVNEKDNELLTQVSSGIVSELQMARSAEPGYERVFFIPYTVEHNSFEVFFPPDSVGAAALSPAEAKVSMSRAGGDPKSRHILLGNDVTGALFNGENKVIKTEDRIMVIPSNMSGLIDIRGTHIVPSIAYAKIVRDNNHVKPLTVDSNISCEFGIVNANPAASLNVRIEYLFRNAAGNSLTPLNIGQMSLGADSEMDTINGIHTSASRRIRDTHANSKGYNVTCRATLVGYSSQTVTSKSIPIEDTPPHIRITGLTQESKDHQHNHYTWVYRAAVNFGDYDHADNNFKVTFVAEGLNAGYLSCMSNCLQTSAAGSHTITFKYSVPKEMGTCAQINTFGFKVKVENNAAPNKASTASWQGKAIC
jgi:hypothetical protein